MSETAGDMKKGGVCVRHALRTPARTSEKVGTVLTYHALDHSTGPDTHCLPGGSRVTVLGPPVHLCPVGPVVERHHGWVAKSVVTGDTCTDRCFKLQAEPENEVSTAAKCRC